MFKLNTVTQLSVFLFFAIMLNLLPFTGLLLTVVILLILLQMLKKHQFYRLCKRLKWFYMVMLCIFAFNTPGEHLTGWPFEVSPTYEGLQAGLTQLLRIIAMLAALSLLLAANTKQQLISGLYFLLSPLKCVGLDSERFAARLWLTLHYVETQQPVPKNSDYFSRFSQHLATILSEAQHDDVTIVLETPYFSWLDTALIVFCAVLLAALLFKVNI